MLLLLSGSAIGDVAAKPLPDNVISLKDYRNGLERIATDFLH
jgi:hypothetical protein